MKLEDVEIMSMAYSFSNKRTFFELSCPGDVTAEIEELKDKPLKLELKRAGKRSLNANRIFMEFAWRITRKAKDTERRYIQAIYL